jgi:hypothetical protein
MKAPVSHWAEMQRPLPTGEAIFEVGGVYVKSYDSEFKRFIQPFGVTP